MKKWVVVLILLGLLTRPNLSQNGQIFAYYRTGPSSSETRQAPSVSDLKHYYGPQQFETIKQGQNAATSYQQTQVEGTIQTQGGRGTFKLTTGRQTLNPNQRQNLDENVDTNALNGLRATNFKIFRVNARPFDGPVDRQKGNNFNNNYQSNAQIGKFASNLDSSNHNIRLLGHRHPIRSQRPGNTRGDQFQTFGQQQDQYYITVPGQSGDSGSPVTLSGSQRLLPNGPINSKQYTQPYTPQNVRIIYYQNQNDYKRNSDPKDIQPQALLTRSQIKNNINVPRSPIYEENYIQPQSGRASIQYQTAIANDRDRIRYSAPPAPGEEKYIQRQPLQNVRTTFIQNQHQSTNDPNQKRSSLSRLTSYVQDPRFLNNNEKFIQSQSRSDSREKSLQFQSRPAVVRDQVRSSVSQVSSDQQIYIQPQSLGNIRTTSIQYQNSQPSDRDQEQSSRFQVQPLQNAKTASIQYERQPTSDHYSVSESQYNAVINQEYLQGTQNDRQFFIPSTQNSQIQSVSTTAFENLGNPKLQSLQSLSIPSQTVSSSNDQPIGSQYPYQIAQAPQRITEERQTYQPAKEEVHPVTKVMQSLQSPSTFVSSQNTSKMTETPGVPIKRPFKINTFAADLYITKKPCEICCKIDEMEPCRSCCSATPLLNAKTLKTAVG